MLAMILSVMPGLGQVYVGYYDLAFRNILVVCGLLASWRPSRDRLEPVVGLFLAFFWLHNIVDAGRRASFYNQALAGLRPWNCRKTSRRRSPWARSPAGAARRRGADALREHDVPHPARLARPVVAAGPGRGRRLAHLRRPPSESRRGGAERDGLVSPGRDGPGLPAAAIIPIRRRHMHHRMGIPVSMLVCSSVLSAGPAAGQAKPANQRPRRRRCSPRRSRSSR